MAAATSKTEGFRSYVRADGSTPFAPEAGRYRLYVALVCPYACRALAVRNLKGLEDVVEVVYAAPAMKRTRPDDEADKHMGWYFTTSDEFSRCTPDPLGHKFVRDIYAAAGDTTSFKFTVPVLWDIKTGTIVNNESAEIIEMFNSEFNALAKHPEVNVLPADLATQMEDALKLIAPLGAGVYQTAIAQTEDDFIAASNTLAEHLLMVERVLQSSRYLTGSRFTEVDARLFATIVRFDAVQVRTTAASLDNFPNIVNHTRDVYQIPGIAETVDLEHIRLSFFSRTSYISSQQGKVLPAHAWSALHDRQRLVG